MTGFEDAGICPVEPDWAVLISDELELIAARDYWATITAELEGRGLLAAANGHAVRRLVLAYLTYDRASRTVFDEGAVTKPRRGNSRAIARQTPHFSIMRESAADAAVLEAELGISPRRRASAAKVERNVRRKRASDSYLRPVG